MSFVKAFLFEVSINVLANFRCAFRTSCGDSNNPASGVDPLALRIFFQSTTDHLHGGVRANIVLKLLDSKLQISLNGPMKCGIVWTRHYDMDCLLMILQWPWPRIETSGTLHKHTCNIIGPQLRECLCFRIAHSHIKF